MIDGRVGVSSETIMRTAQNLNTKLTHNDDQYLEIYKSASAIKSKQQKSPEKMPLAVAFWKTSNLKLTTVTACKRIINKTMLFMMVQIILIKIFAKHFPQLEIYLTTMLNLAIQ
jgi:hypothetical protein